MYHINDLNHIINTASMCKRAFKNRRRMSVRNSGALHSGGSKEVLYKQDQNQTVTTTTNRDTTLRSELSQNMVQMGLESSYAFSAPIPQLK